MSEEENAESPVNGRAENRAKASGQSQFSSTLTAVLPQEHNSSVSSEEGLLLRSEREQQSERFFHRNFGACSFPINLYDEDGTALVEQFLNAGNPLFPSRLQRPENSIGGCAFVVRQNQLYVLYDRVGRWADAPDFLDFIAIKLDRKKIVALASNAPENTELTRSEYALLSHLLAGLDLKLAAEKLGASYDTKRKQIQVIMDKLGVHTQTALLRTLSVDITVRILDEILPRQRQNLETSMVKRQFGRDVVIHKITIGEGIEVPVWEFGDRRGKPVLYFHSMLTPVIFHEGLSQLLRKRGLRLLVMPRHFLGLGAVHDTQIRLTKITLALSEVVTHLVDGPVICLAESAGVCWATHFARHNPEQIHHMVFVATPQPTQVGTAPKSLTLYREMAQKIRQDDRVISGLTRVYNAIARVPMLAKKGLLHMYRTAPSDLACIEDMFQDENFTKWLELIANHATSGSMDEMRIMQRNWSDELAQIRLPITFVHGDEDPISPKAEVMEFSQTLFNAQFHSLADAGHLLLTEHFEKIAELLAALPKSFIKFPLEGGDETVIKG